MVHTLELDTCSFSITTTKHAPHSAFPMTLRRLPRASSVLSILFIVFFAYLFWTLPGGLTVHERERAQPQFGPDVVGGRPATHNVQANDDHLVAGGRVSDGGTGCPEELKALNRSSLRLSSNVIYSRRCIKPIISTTVDRDEVVNVSRPLFQSKQTISRLSCGSDGAAVDLGRCDDVSLRVPPPYPKRTYPELLFGVSSNSQRLADSIDTFAHWLGGSGARLVAVVTDKEEDGAVVNKERLEALRKAFGERDMDAEFIVPSIEGLSASQSHFVLVRDLLKRCNKKTTKWLGILDDDTFFPSLYPLAETLAKYDHTKEQYLGALSEDFQAVQRWGYMAFGGAGIFLSVPTARILDRSIEACLEEGPSEGDGLLRDCIYHRTHAKLTQVPGLYQQDMMGDVSGFFESGPRPLSLHHWKSWYHRPVHDMSLISGLCGDCFLQRWRFGGDTLLVNGYSITVYREGVLEGLELDRMEATWNSDFDLFAFSLGPFRRRLERGEKKTYLLEDAEVVDDGSGTVRQMYVYRAGRKSGEPDEVVELYWEGGY